jgi:hypothetical protein
MKSLLNMEIFDIYFPTLLRACADTEVRLTYCELWKHKQLLFDAL